MTPRSAVVIGGSAGSLDAVHALLAAVPLDTGAAFLIVIHLSPTVESLLPSVIGAYTSMPVREAVDKLPLEANRVIVGPPDYHMLLERDHTVALSRDQAVHFSRPAIDPLFETAAEAYGKRAIGVLLSGSNADGARGLATLAAAKGQVCIQDPKTALSPEMPRAGIEACAECYVGPPSALGRWIAAKLGEKR